MENRLPKVDPALATLYRVLGVDPTVKLLNHGGRPVPAIDEGEPIRELL